jgi:hypothetical protein
MSEAPLVEFFEFGGITFVRRRPRDPTELRLELRAAGFSPIPVRGKNPGFAGWQEKIDVSVEEIKHWGDDVFFRQRRSTGINCRWTPFCDIDIRDEAAAVAVEKLIRDRYGKPGTPVLVRIGRAPKRGVLFRTDAPFTKIVVNLVAPDGSRNDKLEFLASGQQFVAFGIHPDTGKPYHWTGGEPGEVKAKKLPTITEAAARQLMEDAADLLCAEHGYKRASEKWTAREPHEQLVAPGDANAFEEFAAEDEGTVPWTEAFEAKLRSAVDAIPADEAVLTQELGNSHDVFVAIGRALERLGWDERGFAIWNDWCRPSPKYDLKGLRTQWASFRRTRDGTGGRKVTFRTILRYAEAFGWRDPDEQRAEAEPTYVEDPTTGAEDARTALERLMETFLKYELNWWEQYGGLRVVHAVKASTGIGKTRIAARAIARHIKSDQPQVLYAVPTHRLGEDVADLFRAEGLSAEVWRGRKALGKDGKPMCLDLGAVKIAEDLGVNIEDACCRGKDPAGRTVTCQYYETCAYQKQKTRTPDVWLVAHQMLFQANATLGDMSVVFIDESFWEAGTSKPVRGLTLDEIEDAPDNELEIFRQLLVDSLRKQAKLGGVPKQNVHTGLSARNITKAIQLEWAQKGKQRVMWPGMSAKERAAAVKVGTNVRHIRTLDRVWRTLRELVEHESDLVSGRLYLATKKTDDGVVKVVKTRGIHEIAGQYDDARFFLMDATLPAKVILEKWRPDVTVVGEIEVPAPHMRVRQVLGAPITLKKLAGPRNLAAMRRYILKRWVETGRGQTLVVCQKDIEPALKSGLPAAIHVEHFNNVEGLDRYKDVQLLITIGRTQPKTMDVEADAGALSGVEPVKAGMKVTRSTWYDRVTRGVRMREGKGVAVTTDQHPDELAEAIRWQACEAGLMQAIGRGRGVNRTAANPLDVDVLADVVLPLIIDEVQEWTTPGLEIEPLAAGVWLESPADMARAWPGVWATAKAARDWLNLKSVDFPLIIDSIKGDSTLFPLLRFRYQPAGVKQRWRLAWVDPAVVPDARAWLEARLGPLAGYEVATVLVRMMRAVEHTVVPLDFATPAVSVRPGPGQEKFAWATPVVEEIFLTPEEIAALWKLPAVIEGADRFPWPTPQGARTFHVEEGDGSILGSAASPVRLATICKN